MPESFIFYTSPNQIDKKHLCIVSVGDFYLTWPQKTDRPYGHTCEHLVYTTDGHANASIAGEKSRATVGTLWLTPKDKPYCLSADRTPGFWKGRWIEFDGEWARPLMKMLGLSGKYHVAECMEALGVINEIFSLFIERKNDALHESAALLWRLLSILETRLAIGTGNDPIARAKRFIAGNLQHSIGLKEVAKSASMSRFHFLRAFKKETGFTPMDYLRNLRMSRAQELLRFGKLNISQVGYLVGFPQVQHFSSTFKKAVGKSPREFKRSL